MNLQFLTLFISKILRHKYLDLKLRTLPVFVLLFLHCDLGLLHLYSGDSFGKELNSILENLLVQLCPWLQRRSNHPYLS